MFRTLIYLSPGACDYFVELPHWSYCSWFDVCWNFGVVGLEWYPCCRLKPAILFHVLYARHVSDINISIIRSLRLFCWITTLVVLFLVRCVLEFRCGWFGVVSVLQAEACHTDTNTRRTTNNTTNVVIQQNSRKLLMMDILMSETCRAHKTWNRMASDIKLVFYSSTITMMHGPINIRTFIATVNVLCNRKLHDYFSLRHEDKCNIPVMKSHVLFFTVQMMPWSEVSMIGVVAVNVAYWSNTPTNARI